MKKIYYFVGFFSSLLLITACSFFANPEIKPNTNPDVALSKLDMQYKSVTMKVGETKYIQLSAEPVTNQGDAKITWEYDTSYFTVDADNYGIVLTAKKEGQTTVKVRNNSLSSVCVITISGVSLVAEKDPYIYSSYSLLELQKDMTTKVNVSLYGGVHSDMQNFSWSVDKPSIVSIEKSGQYCQVRGLHEGVAQITITHPSAAYSYNIQVFVYEDVLKSTYITTSQNILQMNRSDGNKTLTVDLRNSSSQIYKQQFQYSVVNETGTILDTETAPISITPSNDTVIISPKNAGTCKIRIFHPDASYSFDVLVRVVTLVENVYITPSPMLVTLFGKTSKTVSAVLDGLKDGKSYDKSEFVWSVDKTDLVNLDIAADTVNLTATGIDNGIATVTVRHPLAEYSRQIVVVLRDQVFVDASMYITTSQNYVRTKIGQPPSSVDISLYGGIAGDETKFEWEVAHTSDDESNAEVIKLETTTGIIKKSRTVHNSYAYGTAIITPLKAGTAVITIKHPKILYATEILVKVLPEHALLEKPLFLSVPPLITLLTGQTKQIEAIYSGNFQPDDLQNTQWKIDSPTFSLAANSNQAQITATTEGIQRAKVTVNNPKADTEKTILLLSAATEEELASIKALFADKLNFTAVAEKSLELIIQEFGLTDEDKTNISWSTSDSNISSIQQDPNNPLQAQVLFTKAGTCDIVARLSTHPEVDPVKFKITVYPKGTDISTSFPEAYLSTTTNVVTMQESGETRNVSISLVNISAASASQTKWEIQDSTVCSISANGSSATITALSEGETILSVSHPEAENILKIVCRVGNDLVFDNPDLVYIIADRDIIQIVKDKPDIVFNCSLVGSKETNGFTFSIDDPAIAEINGYTTGNCFVKPKEAGQALITIKHPDAEYDKLIVVTVANSESELADFAYITTVNNVVSINQAQSQIASVSIRNSSSQIVDGYIWETSDPNIVSVISSGNTAVLFGNTIGTARISVKHPSCLYPLEIIASVVNPIAASANPFITPSQNIVPLVVDSTSWTDINVKLMGGNASDNSGFTWIVNDTSVAQVLGQNENAKVRAIKDGTTFATITHPKAQYEARILLICETQKQTNCYISVPESIITMKPTDSAKSITASLINGTAEDKYAFSWFADTYDVVDLSYSANVASIKPLAQGETIIHIKHPKAAYEQQVIVKVSEFTAFSFGADSQKITAGQTLFLNMQIPSTSNTTYVNYSSDSPMVCDIRGTKAVAQLTALKKGTTTVRAQLISSNNNAVLAKTELLVAVEDAPTDLIYITSPNTTYTVEKNLSKTISATLTGTGISQPDQNNLQWKSSDPSVLKIAGASASGIAVGQQVIVQALKSGECTITVSHDKSSTNLVLYFIVPGTNEKNITLNRTYANLQCGNTVDLKATISNGTADDYKSILWTTSKNGIVQILGNSQTVQIYAVTPGNVAVRAQLTNGKYAECEIAVSQAKAITFYSDSEGKTPLNHIKIEPYQDMQVYFDYTPETSILQWIEIGNEQKTWATEPEAINYEPNKLNTFTLKAKKRGTGTLNATSQFGTRGMLGINVAWDYFFNIKKNGNPLIAADLIKEPRADNADPYRFKWTYELPYYGHLYVNSSDSSVATISAGDGNITINPLTEGTTVLQLNPYNTLQENEEFLVQSKVLKLAYENLTLNVKGLNIDGKFSRIAGDTIYVGDGETFRINASVLEPGAKCTFVFTAYTNSSYVAKESVGSDYIDFVNRNDKVNREYLVVNPYTFITSTGQTPHAWDWVRTTDTYHSPALGTNYAYRALIGQENVYLPSYGIEIPVNRYLYHTQDGVASGTYCTSAWVVGNPSPPYVGSAYHDVNHEKRITSGTVRMSIDEFNRKYKIPEHDIKWHWGSQHSRTAPAMVLCDSYTEVNSIDTTVTDQKSAGSLTIKVDRTAVGKSSISKTYTIVYEERKCSKTGT